MVSCLPASVAVSEPDPATVDIMVKSMGTGDSRALNVSAAGTFCAPAVCPTHAVPNNRIAAHSKNAVKVRRVDVVFFNAQAMLRINRRFHFQVCADHTRAAPSLQAHIQETISIFDLQA